MAARCTHEACQEQAIYRLFGVQRTTRGHVGGWQMYLPCRTHLLEEVDKALKFKPETIVEVQLLD